MVMLAPLNKQWQDRLRFRTLHTLPFFTETGLCLGSGTILVKGVQGRVRFVGSEIRVLSLLRTALDPTIAPESLAYLRRADLCANVSKNYYLIQKQDMALFYIFILNLGWRLVRAVYLIISVREVFLPAILNLNGFVTSLILMSVFMANKRD